MFIFMNYIFDYLDILLYCYYYPWVIRTNINFMKKPELLLENDNAKKDSA